MNDTARYQFGPCWRDTRCPKPFRDRHSPGLGIVAQHMGRHPFLGQGGASALGGGDMFGECVLHRVRTEPAAAAARKEKARSLIALFLEPRFQNRHRGFGQGRTPLLSTLPLAANMRPCAQDRVLLP